MPAMTTLLNKLTGHVVVVGLRYERSMSMILMRAQRRGARSGKEQELAPKQDPLPHAGPLYHDSTHRVWSDEAAPRQMNAYMHRLVMGEMR